MILVSACLAGEPVRYDGKSCLTPLLATLIAQGKVKTVCPELLGGFSTPRLAAEIQYGTGADVLNGDAKVVDSSGQDVTAMYLDGAKKTLHYVQKLRPQCIVLKENSPSCGSAFIYDGHFQQKKRHGFGVTTTLLQQHGFQVISEHELPTWLDQHPLD
ncbi:DUF523 domain-containing protein [Acinetobacter sp. MD2(2019)]|uniref:DUF523 domain-containing protein n=1 Tax=Acinetobacter sp. MD2(2019) TaxID=2605273 RepID=UPI002D1EF5CE|nr:DUF523 domain-containing protein [Acinetobacter sp. MD2(2019)]MEB3754394.1 DUF523 domain-containing protein [Acinetobacter sp. MD2(2019)]